MQAFLAPGIEAIGALDNMRYKGKNTKKYGDHYKAMYEAIMAISWVTMAPPMGLPKQHVEQQAQAVDFNLNRVLKNDKSDEVKAWNLKMKAMSKKLSEFVKEYFKSSGLTWNPKGGALSEAKESAASTSGGAPATGAAAAAEEKKEESKPKKSKKKGGGGGMAGVFGELNKGLAVTKGMKKVTKDMKTKNRKDRVGKVTVKKAAPKKKRKKFGDPQTKFMGGRWMVENYEAEAGLIVLDKANLKSNVFISMCDEMTVQVPGKVKAVTIGMFMHFVEFTILSLFPECSENTKNGMKWIESVPENFEFDSVFETFFGSNLFPEHDQNGLKLIFPRIFDIENTVYFFH